ncbi:ly6/PLAUR domain-containing protein 8 isoform X1 [Cervus canadensis]|uniref:ly6/PLAUR domain-containing protein 8 isoform X1 n=1 Tax=Cervus canadensis TaxID=1574408 RepID=UPI001C9E37E6|nr:ly6/PLAUR domain-containing protein 8 isoform X1 [Cervus canadensis]
MSSTMKGFLFTGIIVMLTVAAVESQYHTLHCVQCNSLKDGCIAKNATECPSNANTSCTSFSTNFSQGENSVWYEDHACSAENCSETTVQPFMVYVSEKEIFHFESQCCLGEACNQTGDATAPPQQVMPSIVECPACYGNNETSCNETRKCSGERCVSIIAEFINETTTLVLKGCSNVSNSTCEFLGVANQMFRGITFRKFECGDNSSTPTTTSPTSTTSDTVAQASFTPLALASILLLRLLL